MSDEQHIQVNLWLRVENNSKFVRGKKRTRELIELLLLQHYSMEKHHLDGWEYTLTIPYTSDEELDAIIYELLREAESIADRHSCFTEADVSALDGSERYW